MRSIYQVVLALLLLLTPVVMEGQGSALRRGDAQYNRGEFYNALQYYNQVIADGYKLDQEYQIKVGHCYYQLNNVDEAYAIFSELEDKLTGYDLYIYASTTHKIGYYVGAIDLYKKAKPQNPERVGLIDELIRSCEWAMDNQMFLPVRVNPSKIMTFGQSFGLQYYKDGVVYSSASPEKEGGKIDRQGRNFLSLYYSDLDGDEIKNTRLFSKKLVFEYHVGAISFSPDEKTMYYTKTVRVRGGDNKLKIFSVVFDGQDWVDEVDLNINSSDYDNAHPAVTPDGKYLVFVSNRPGGYGGKDLWMAEIKSNRTLTGIRNLGPKVNSFGDELFPFVGKDNTLYFSSDGHTGFGGLDLFKSDYVNGNWGEAKNLGQPYNSNRDDFGYVINPNDNQRGFLSSNRVGDGSDAIFYVQEREEEKEEEEDSSIPIAGIVYQPEEVLEEEVIEEPIVIEEPKVDLSIFPSSLKSYVLSTLNGNLLEGASISLVDSYTGRVVGRSKTDSKGSFLLSIPDEYRQEGQEFKITVSKDDFRDNVVQVNIMEVPEIAKGGFQLSPIFKDQDLNEISGLIIPYVGLEFSVDGYAMLDQVAAYLLNNPQVVIKLNGHTDARGTMITNLNNSQSISEKAENYLLSKGVSSENLISRGYGERYLVNKCGRGKLCDESEHLENRRVEVVVWRTGN